MKIRDCYWEKNNLGVSTAEIIVENDDVFDRLSFENINSDYEYKVVKVPEKKVDFNIGLASLGYTFIETQIQYSMKVKVFDFQNRWLTRLEPYVQFEKVNTPNELNELLSRITPEMFITDRISLDPSFGPSIGCQRYKNWILSEFDQKSSVIQKTFFKGEFVGFGMYKVKDRILHATLGGIFSDVNYPIGLLVPSNRLLQIKREGIDVDEIRTSVSSNNKPVWQLYNSLHFTNIGISYVFIKH